MPKQISTEVRNKRSQFLTAQNLKHGHAYRGKKSRTYNIWVAMRTRCNNPNQACYKHYGGRGIKVCERWNTFANFLADMGNCPTGMTIERKNRDGDYEPSNCKWATRKEQMRNFGRNKILTIHGVTACLSELCEKFNTDADLISCRLSRGWSEERAFNTPVRQGNYRTGLKSS